MSETTTASGMLQIVTGIIEAYYVADFVRSEVNNKVTGEYNSLRDLFLELKEDGVALSSVNTVLKNIEREWAEKKATETGNSVSYAEARKMIPKAYSSAKSVLLKGYALGTLTDGIGKTALEKASKEKRGSSVSCPLSPEMELMETLGRAMYIVQNSPLTNLVALEGSKAYIDMLGAHIDSHLTALKS